MTVASLASGYHDQAMGIRAAAIKDFAGLWSLLDVKDLDGSFTSYATAIQYLIESHSRRVAQSANQFYQEVRSLEGVSESWTPAFFEQTVANAMLESLYFTGPVQVKKALKAGLSLERALANAFVASAGSISRQILNGGRNQIINNVTNDKQAVGWYRIAHGNSCAFCLMLASRGAVYKTEWSADFQAHDHCACDAAPVFSYKEPDHHIGAKARELWKNKTYDGERKTTSKNDISNRELNAFRRALYAYNNESR
ncbi:hypothetical protein O1L55_20680 [Streptomyces albulus]|nr:hypothetical protein [Streptomyces noursei]